MKDADTSHGGCRSGSHEGSRGQIRRSVTRQSRGVTSSAGHGVEIGGHEMSMDVTGPTEPVGAGQDGNTIVRSQGRSRPRGVRVAVQGRVHGLLYFHWLLYYTFTCLFLPLVPLLRVFSRLLYSASPSRYIMFPTFVLYSRRARRVPVLISSLYMYLNGPSR
jgi:hypothetical protein